jgi:hypothetical protein
MGHKWHSKADFQHCETHANRSGHSISPALKEAEISSVGPDRQRPPEAIAMRVDKLSFGVRLDLELGLFIIAVARVMKLRGQVIRVGKREYVVKDQLGEGGFAVIF